MSNNKLESLKITPEIMWAIYNPDFGFFVGTQLTKKDAISAHTLDLGINWEECRKGGDIAIRVLISPIQNTEVDHETST